jgi:glycosyltransferase involved in cell wall biosynthesis
MTPVTPFQNDARVALCHEWFTTLGGSDICAARIAELVDADEIFAFTYRPAFVRELLGNRAVRVAHRMGSLRAAQDHWQWFLPLMPLAWRGLDLSSFDVVVTSSHACTNAVRVPAGGALISYCYTPMRYAWDPRQEIDRLPPFIRAMWPAAAGMFRRADKRWAQRVDGYIAISKTVAERIARFYGRESHVVYPPVDTAFFTPGSDRSEAFLAAGRLVGYKRFDVAVDAFTRLGYPLVVAGSGPELKRLRERAGPTVRFEVQPARERLRELYRNARALVFPGVEDFGIVPVEAQACGTPVIARALGGVTETVVDGHTGVLYGGEDPAALIAGVKEFEALSLDGPSIRSHSERFGTDAFDAAFLAAVGSIVGE